MQTKFFLFYLNKFKLYIYRSKNKQVHLGDMFITINLIYTFIAIKIFKSRMCFSVN